MIDKALLGFLYLVLVYCTLGSLGVKFNYSYDEDASELSFVVKLPQVEEKETVFIKEDCGL